MQVLESQARGEKRRSTIEEVVLGGKQSADSQLYDSILIGNHLLALDGFKSVKRTDRCRKGEEARSTLTTPEPSSRVVHLDSVQYLIQVRNDLERVRMLAELVRKREQEKLRQARIVKQFVEQSIFPFDAAMQAAFTNIAQYVCLLVKFSLGR